VRPTPEGPARNRRFDDGRLARALREVEVARAELDDMALRAIVAAESVNLISSLVSGPNGDAIHEVADMVLEACTLADVIGQRLAKVGDTLATVGEPDVSGMTERTAETLLSVTVDGVIAVGPGLTKITQDDVDAIFG
jgi:uncharacterized protein with PhoU and TrkA domain